jgi:hypothetical protein
MTWGFQARDVVLHIHPKSSTVLVPIVSALKVVDKYPVVDAQLTNAYTQ